MKYDKYLNSVKTIKKNDFYKLINGCKYSKDIILKILRYISVEDCNSRELSIYCLICHDQSIYNKYTILNHFIHNHLNYY